MFRHSITVRRDRELRKSEFLVMNVYKNEKLYQNFYFSGISDARTVILHRAKRGFGFVLRGAKAASPLMQLKPSDRCPGLQYLDDVDPGGVADLSGLKPGDFLLEVSSIFQVRNRKKINFEFYSDKWRRRSMCIA